MLGRVCLHRVTEGIASQGDAALVFPGCGLQWLHVV